MGVVENIDSSFFRAGRACEVSRHATGVLLSRSISRTSRFSATATSIVLEVYLWQRFEEAA
jgi:hypothetical protein